ncbi:unnamed protein product [Sphagnum troendelagicum]|uniref:RING-type E3 ubiquitin transferase n=1 Tax=Sphagnum troendelagicum TaxID=128251 RepID=A0ABP0UYX8_9BRYO
MRPRGGAVDEKVAAVPVPPFFKCPISLELMRDPVVLSTGQSYERSSIELWLKAGNQTCPATMQKLSSLELVPNHTLRRLIHNWCRETQEAGSTTLNASVVPILATPKLRQALMCVPDTVATMLHQLRSSTADPLPILKNIRSLARESERTRKWMQESEVAVTVLASVMTSAAAEESSSSAATVEIPSCCSSMQRRKTNIEEQDEGISLNAAAGARQLQHSCGVFSLEASEEALAILALLTNSRHRRELLKPRSVAAIAWFLCKGRSLDAKVNAATVFAAIMQQASLETDDQSQSQSSCSIGAAADMIPPNALVLEALAKMLREDLYPKAIQASLKALLTICIPRRNRIKVVEVGSVIPLLIELLPEAKRSNIELALGVLELLCTTAEGRAAVAHHALAMAALVHHLHTVSHLATELSVAIIWSVCKASSDCQLLAAQQSGLFAALLLLLQLDCSPRTRLKAHELLKLLCNPWMQLQQETPCAAWNIITTKSPLATSLATTAL